jgi:hypothetical protein
MTGTSRESFEGLEAAMRLANPVPLPSALTDSRESSAVSLLVSRRRRAVHPDNAAPPEARHRWRGPTIAVGAFAVVLAIGLPLLLLRDGDESPVVATAAATTTGPNTTAAAAPGSGLVWARVPHDEGVFGGPDYQEASAVVAGGPGVVAVGYDTDASGGEWDLRAAVWTSPDGLVWSRVPHDEAVFGGYGSRVMSGVVAGGPGVVAVGLAVSDSGDPVAAVWTSPDGLVWSRVPHDEAVFGGSCYLSAVVAGGPGLVAVGYDTDTSSEDWDDDAAVWTSPDGLVWSRVPHDEAVFGGSGDQSMRGVTAGGPGLVAVGLDLSGGDLDAAVWTSPDGLVWSRVAPDEVVFGGLGNQEMKAVAAVGPGLVAVGLDHSDGDDDAAAWVSPPPG